MARDYFISVYLDTRRALKNGKYPVKIRVFTPVPRKQKLYPTKFEFTKDEFTSIWETVKTRNEYKTNKRALQSILDKAEDVAKEINPFNLDQFEKSFYQKPGAGADVFARYEAAINQYTENGQIGTAKSYGCSAKSLKWYSEQISGKNVLTFPEITVSWLNRYERFMQDNGKSVTSIGIYLRPLRALFHAAIKDKTVKTDIYPFGKGKYEIPAPKSVKKALNKDQLKQLFDAVPANEYQQRAKDFWFFLFNTSGMNIKDLIRLKYRNLKGDMLTYVREKTKRTTKAKQTPVVVYLNEYATWFIQKYGNPDRNPDNYIFDIVSLEMSEQEIFNKAGAFTRTLNQHVKLLATANGLPADISTYWSRHSFATNAVRNGASLEQIRQALNHHTLSTTEGYFAGFEDDTMKQIAYNLMNF